MQPLGLFFTGKFRPRAVNFHTVHSLGERDFQPDRQAGVVGNGAIFGIEEGAAAESDDGFFSRS